MHLEVAYTRSPVHHLGNDDCHLAVLKRVGGGPDTKTPRYFMATGPRKKVALANALDDARTRLGVEVELRTRVDA